MALTLSMAVPGWAEEPSEEAIQAVEVQEPKTTAPSESAQESEKPKAEASEPAASETAASEPAKDAGEGRAGAKSAEPSKAAESAAPKAEETVVQEPTGETADNTTEPTNDESSGTDPPATKSEPKTRVSAATATVTFMLNNTEEYLVSGFAPQTLAVGSTVKEPIHPTVPSGYVTFRGWSIYNPAHPDHDFSFYTRDKFWAFDGTSNANTVTDDVILYAVFDDRWLLSFIDGDGLVVLTRRVSAGETYAGPTAAVLEAVAYTAPTDGARVIGWEEDPDSGYTGGDVVFGSSYMPNHDLTIRPKWATTRVVTFDSRGGNYIAPLLPIYNTKIDAPTAPTRTGYEFACWVASASATDCTSAWDFSSTPVTADTTLYAIWDAKYVGYTVVYWGEKKGVIGDPGTTVTNYEYLSSVSVAPTSTLAKPAGSSLSCSSNCFTSAERTALNSLSAFPSYYTLSWVDSQPLAGNGTTVVNVYFKRTVYTLEFNAQASRTDVSSPVTTGAADPDPTAYLVVHGVTYQKAGDPNENVKYSFTAKLDQDISALWPENDSAIAQTTGAKHFGWYLGKYNATSHSVQVEFSPTLAAAAELNGGLLLLAPEWSTDASVVPVGRLYYYEATSAELKYISDNSITVPYFSD
ncbi:MAG: InlB B-repeat-containing protein, partial [Propionibacteriaceae bacterium]|nr:InlB B-repeat-containing protein [Propionibacteriaceae bacterium]